MVKKNKKGAIIVHKDKKCPPHCLPHKLPFTKKIKDEICHIHKKKINMLHHVPYCKFFLKCEHYKLMVKFDKDFSEKSLLTE